MLSKLHLWASDVRDGWRLRNLSRRMSLVSPNSADTLIGYTRRGTSSGSLVMLAAIRRSSEYS